MRNRTMMLLPAAALLVAVVGCGNQAQDVTAPTPTTAAAASWTYTESPVPPQPTPIVGKYADPEAMAAKLTAAGVPFVADATTSYDVPDQTDVNGAQYLYGTIGKDRVGLKTFDWPKVADDSETSSRSQGVQTYRGDGWIVSAKNPAALAAMVDALNK